MELPKFLDRLKSELARFDAVLSTNIYPEEEPGVFTLDVTYWGEPSSKVEAEVDREIREAGFRGVDSMDTSLGFFVRYQLDLRGNAREAVERMTGEARMALALAPVASITDADLDEMARRSGDMADARRPDGFRPYRVNPHV